MTRKERCLLLRATADIFGEHEADRRVLLTLAGAIQQDDETLASFVATVDRWRDTVGVPTLMKGYFGNGRQHP